MKLGRVVYLFVVLSVASMGFAPMVADAQVGLQAVDPAFVQSVVDIEGPTPQNPTSLDFGPDDRLYVAERLGTIRVYEVERQGQNDYVATQVDVITEVGDIPNHDDEGNNEPTVTDRQVTGLTVAGTASVPVIYVSSSDPRVGGGTGGINDLDIDTNSGTISRLTSSGNDWDHDVLVRGLPRSAENHATNGLQYDASTNVLYAAQGGNTNAGAPSDAFVLVPEYALTTAILSIDLDSLGSLPYDIPTLDGGSTPFGGENGDNQAIIAEGGPVQVFAAGLRNAYDLVLTESGEFYTVDNGGNQGWGGVPVGCDHDTVNGGITIGDTLHRVDAGYYGGHPNPTRGNAAMFPDAVPKATAECVFHNPGNPSSAATPSGDSEALVVFPGESVNGITEYTATNFEGAMQGDLLTTNLIGNLVYRVQVDPGEPVNVGADVDEIFTGVGNHPLDIVAVGDDGEFPGTVWVADIGSQNQGGGGSQLFVFEPDDSFCPDGLPDDDGGDADGDDFTNADEYDNDTNPCSPASFPPDADGDGISDLNDSDDDNDGTPDTSDRFALDNITPGTPADVPFRISWDGSSDVSGGVLNTGFTGLMVNGSNYEDLFERAPMTIGGAAELMTIPATDGDAYGGGNDQEYAFQLGVDVPNDPFLIEARLPSPLAASGFDDFQSAGIYIGSGTQSSFVRVAAIANGGAGGVEAVREVSDSPQTVGSATVGLASLSYIDLTLRVDPNARTVQAGYRTPGGSLKTVGSPTSIPASWLSGSDGLALGIIATSTGSGSQFGATYEYIEVSLDPNGSNPPPPPPPPPDGDTFTDDDGSIFEDDIEWLAATGITRGCNPPVNDRFCPDENVTRGQMAAFFVRALGLSDGAGADLFVDDDGTTFEGDIDRFGTEGVTRGCNPPVNDRYCPGENVTRAQMAAFFVRALGLSDGAGADLFVDDDGTIFEGDIDRFGTEGITRGCNPPANDRYCPGENVTRGQMAAFFHRAASLLGLPG